MNDVGRLFEGGYMPDPIVLPLLVISALVLLYSRGIVRNAARDLRLSDEPRWLLYVYILPLVLYVGGRLVVYLL